MLNKNDFRNFVSLRDTVLHFLHVQQQTCLCSLYTRLWDCYSPSRLREQRRKLSDHFRMKQVALKCGSEERIHPNPRGWPSARLPDDWKRHLWNKQPQAHAHVEGWKTRRSNALIAADQILGERRCTGVDWIGREGEYELLSLLHLLTACALIEKLRGVQLMIP